MSNLLPYLLTLIQEYGYPILWLSIFIGALGIPLPNSLVLLAAGAFAALGNFNFAILAVVATSAFVAGDNASYWLGRRWGSKVLHWITGRLIKPSTLERSRIYFERLGGWAIFSSRFLVSALGGAINLLAGAEFYPYKRFVLFDIAGEIVGALLPLSLGYIFGASWDAVGDLLGSFSLFIVALLVAIVLGYQTLRYFRRMRKITLEKRAAMQRKAAYEKSLDVSTVLPGLSKPDAPPSSANDLPL